jgi:hypothetical protein
MYIVQDVTGPGALPLGCCALSLLGTRAGSDEGLLPLSFSNLLYMENPYSYKECQ